MRNLYKSPMLITLEGTNERLVPVLNPPLAMYNESYSTLNGLSLDFLWRPSKARKTFGTIAAGSAALAAMVPVTAPVAGSVAAVSGGAAGLMQVAYGVNKGGSTSAPSTGSGFKVQGPPPPVPVSKI